MELENYVMNEYLRKIMKVDENGNKYILKQDIDRFHFKQIEVNFILGMLEKYQIGYREEKEFVQEEVQKVEQDELISEKDRTRLSKNFDYGKPESNGVSDKDISKIAEAEYVDGQLVFEDYEELKRYIDEEFLPNRIKMTQLSKRETSDRELVRITVDKNGKKRRIFRREMRPSVQLKDLVELRLSDLEYEYVLDYLNELGIVVRGNNSSIDQDFDNYNYCRTYMYTNLPKGLSREENFEKFALYEKTKDPALREEIILGNMWIVPAVAWKYALGDDKDIHELESYGYEALIKAVDTYDYKRGVSFVRHAKLSIKYFIFRNRKDLEPIHNAVWIDTFYQCKKEIEEATGKVLSENIELVDDIFLAMVSKGEEALERNPDAQVAIKLSKNQKNLQDQIEDNMQKILYMCQFSLDDQDFVNKLNMNVMEEFLTVDNVERDYEMQDLQNRTCEMLQRLPEKKRKFIELRFGMNDGCPKTLEEVGDKLNVTRERIRQTESRTIRRLRNPLYSGGLREFVKSSRNVEVCSNPREVEGFIDSIVYPEQYDSKWQEEFSKEWDKAVSLVKRKR